MANAPLRIGELATRTGISVRTLHHYEEIGLLVPAHRTDAGHRLYGSTEVRRLQQILSLKHLGFPLNKIGDLLGGGEREPKQVIREQVAALRSQIASQEKLRRQLEALAVRYELADVEEFIQAIQEMTMFEKYYTKEQLETLAERREVLGDVHIREVEAEWPRLIADVKNEMENGTDPKDPRMLALAKRWMELVNEFTGGDPGIAQSLSNLYRNESGFAAKQSLDSGIFGYVRKALS
jgi:DNA-binding transcriptional MerR regulator